MTRARELDTTTAATTGKMDLGFVNRREMRAKIYITYHKDTHLVKKGIITPIQVGNGQALEGCSTRDNTGANIASRNDRYCELTAAYWAWQNDADHDYIGLLHYRRFLDFQENKLQLDEWGVVNWPAFTTDFESKFGLDDAAVMAAIENFDIILPKKWSVRQAGFRSLEEHYSKAPHHHASDLSLCRAVIARRCPQYLPSWQRVLKDHQGWFNNMFVFRRTLFREYCTWLFPLLEEVEQEIPFDRYGEQEQRVIGYLAERLLNAWVVHYLSLHPQTRIRELDRVFIADPSPRLRDPAIASGQEDVISVVVASDNNYAPHLGALIASIFDNISETAIVDLLILDGGITKANQAMLKQLVPRKSAVHFIPMHDEFASHFTHMHFSRATFYRLTLDSMLSRRDKVIYIDCDTIVLGDLSELWNVNLEDRPIAAVHDYIMDHFCKRRVLSSDFTGSLPAQTYLRNYVGIAAEHCGSYFQAGVLILNLRRIRELGHSNAMIECLQNRKYWFLDQDVLNKYYCGTQVSLPAEWNFVNCADDITGSLSSQRAQELEQARRNLKLIHYAGYEAKPWINRNAYLGEYYFYYLRRTHWYEEVLGLRGSQPEAPAHIPPTLRRLWRRLPWFVRRVVNPAAYAIRRCLQGN